ncbi:toll/interleukin-1 receptor domain-containing protein [Amaricoccus macauensis]|uniref:toll/interleukin-1 receptor domain-containing protein n=1 Tax=Amaricoccus macauensis TaxID=57001 RepID=UPI003C7EC177
MANPQHVEWLLEGVEAWNARRIAEDIAVVTLQDTDIYGAFKDAGKLTPEGRIPLSGINFLMCNLSGANLKLGNLRGATFGINTISDADLRGADLRNTFLGDSRDNGPSAMSVADADIRTFWQRSESTGELRPVFTDLRGATLDQPSLDSMNGDIGVILPEGLHHPAHWPDPEPPKPDTPFQTVDPSQPFIFLSYSSHDRDLVGRYRSFFEQQNLSIWWDQYIPAGGAWRETIAEKLETAAAVLTFWTEASTKSTAVIEEASSAQASRKLLHARVDSSTLPYGFGETQYVDLRGWDGTATHAEMAKLLQAMRDKLAPPPRAALETRLSSASPVAFEPKNGKIAAFDTPPHVPPPISNPDDLKARLEGLFQSVGMIAARIEDRIYQVPPDLAVCMKDIVSLREHQEQNWYTLDFTRQSLADCIAIHDGRECWNSTLVRQLDQIIQRIGDLEPLLRPKQPATGDPDAKPPVPDPDLAGKNEKDLEEIAFEASEALEAPEAQSVLDPTAQDALARAVADLAGAVKMLSFSPEGEDRRSSRIRRALRRLGMVLAALVMPLATGVTVELLTSADAAVVLIARFQAILEKILPFFL